MDYKGAFEDAKRMENRAIYLYPAFTEPDREAIFVFAQECHQFCRDCLEAIDD